MPAAKHRRTQKKRTPARGKKSHRRPKSAGAKKNRKKKRYNAHRTGPNRFQAPLTLSLVRKQLNKLGV